MVAKLDKNIVKNNYQNNKIRNSINKKRNFKMTNEDCLSKKAIVKIVRIEDEINNDYKVKRNNLNFDSNIFSSIGINDSFDKSTISSNPLFESQAYSFVNSIPLKVPATKINGKKTLKINFCIYCEKLYLKLSRHLAEKHKDEERVKEFLKLPKNYRKRKILVNNLVRQGNFLHKTDPKLKTDILITNRQKQLRFNKKVQDLVMCTCCQGFFSKKIIHIHIRKCSFIYKKTSRIKKYVLNLRKNNIQSMESIDENINNDNNPSFIKHYNDNADTKAEFEDSMDEESNLEMIDDDTEDTESDFEIVKAEEPYITDENSASVSNLLHMIDSNESFEKPVSNITDFSPGQSIDARSLKLLPAYVNGKKLYKKDFCLFCKKLIVSLAKHLSRKHKKEKKVEEFLKLPKHDPLRKQLINKLRLEGNFLHNTDSRFNTGILITRRQLQTKAEDKTAEDFLICSSCRGFFAKNTIRVHYNNCNPNHVKGTRNIVKSGRQLSNYIHPIANDVLRKSIIPIINSDTVVRSIKYDELILMVGNKLTQEYNDPDYDRIRSKLRLLERFKRALMHQIEGLDQLSSVLQPDFYDATLEAIYECTDCGEKSLPRTTVIISELNALLKVAVDQWICECFKRNNEVEKNNAEKYIQLYNRDFPTLMNMKNLKMKIDSIRKKKRLLITNGKKDSFQVSNLTEKIKDVTDESESLNTVVKEDNQNVNFNYVICKKEDISFKLEMPENDDIIKVDDNDYHEDNNVKSNIHRRWTEAEKNAVTDSFGDLDKLKKLPSLEQCREAIQKYSAISHRTAPQIKTWINNQKKAKF